MFALQRALWIVGTILEFGLLFAMLAKRLDRRLPCFFAYVFANCLRTVALWLLRPSSSLPYAYVYWIGELIIVALGFLAIFEIYRDVLRPYEGLWRLARVLTKWAVIVISGIAALATFQLISGQFPLFTTIILRFQSSVVVAQAGLLLFLFLFASSLGLRWSDAALGFGIGFFMLSLMGIVSVAIADTFKRMLLYALCQEVAYDAVLLVWVFYLMRQEVNIRVKMELPDSTILRQWNEVLEEFVTR